MSVPVEKIIELKELRIGNLLTYKGQIVHVTSLSLDIDDEYQDLIGFCKLGETTKEKIDWNRALAGDLDRIPIAPEWLERLGFERRLEYWEPFVGDAKGTWYRRFDIFLVVLKDGGKIFRAIATNGDEFGYVDGPELTSVHQLQNRYFALTGDELTVTPS